MATAADQIGTLQAHIDGVQVDARTIHAAIDHADVTSAARRILVGALNYGLDLLDIFPDHYAGLGLADDAAVLRLAARHAVHEGAADLALRRLAAQGSEVDQFFGELAAPLDRFVVQLADREVRGRTADQILSSKDVRVLFDADVNRAIAQLQPGPIAVGIGGPEAAVKELLKMTRSSLKKAGLV